MKIALACQSVLLEKSLEIFLKKYIAPYKQCDFVISDRKLEIEKPLFFISAEDANLNIPFTSSKLFLEIEKFFNEKCNLNNDFKEISTRLEDDKLEKLEDKITKMTDEFRNNLIGVIKEYYEK